MNYLCTLIQTIECMFKVLDPSRKLCLSQTFLSLKNCLLNYIKAWLLLMQRKKHNTFKSKQSVFGWNGSVDGAL